MRRLKYAGVVLLSVFLIAGCEKQDATYSEPEPEEENREVRIYYIDDATAEPVSEEVLVSDENDI